MTSPDSSAGFGKLEMSPLALGAFAAASLRLAAWVQALTVVSVDELLTMHSRNVSKGGMFVATDRPRRVGERLVLEVVHPETFDVFHLPSIVRREVHERGHGMAVEFLDCDESARTAFWDFISAGLQKQPDDDFELVIDEGDPSAGR